MGVLMLLVGLAVLIIGGDFLVRGAVSFSKLMKMSSLVIGMTVVAFGTSAPELLVSLKSAMAGNSGIAIGNVIGSNIANITLVLGLTVIIFPVIVPKQTMYIDLPMMMASTLLFFCFALDGFLSIIEGVVLLVILLLFTTFLITKSRKEEKNRQTEGAKALKQESFWKSILFLLSGFFGLYFGAEWFIDGAVLIGDFLLEGNQNKDSIIGVTIVAFGTSIPELVTSSVAAYRKEANIFLGNLIGSNIFNILLVIGTTSIISPIPVSQEVIGFDMIYMIFIVLLLILMLALGKKIGRLKGIIFILSYIAYIVLILFRINGLV